LRAQRVPPELFSSPVKLGSGDKWIGLSSSDRFDSLSPEMGDEANFCNETIVMLCCVIE
jgi:hypothetical protein